MFSENVVTALVTKGKAKMKAGKVWNDHRTDQKT
jgi:hypothetical protein